MSLPPNHNHPSSSSPLHTSIRTFTSQWFLIPQGTGILSVILHQLNHQFTGLQTISIIFWLTTLTTLTLFLLIYATRLVLFPHDLGDAIAHDPVEAACLSSISISLTSIIQMTALVVIPSTWGDGPGWRMAVYVLWWITTALALACCLCLPAVFVRSVQKQGGLTQGFTPAAQLPLIAALTSAAGAGTLCNQTGLLSVHQQIPAIIVGYLEIGIGIPLALAMDTLFWTRIFLPWGTETQNHHANIPLPRKQIFAEMILCGPWGQGSFAMQGLGKAVLAGAFGQYSSGGGGGKLISEAAAGPVGYGSIFFGLLSWGAASFWWFFACVAILGVAVRGRKESKRWWFGFRGLPFSLTTWSVVFPWGVYTNAAVSLGKLLDSPPLKIWSTILAVGLVILWFACVAGTVKGVIDGRMLGLENGWRRRKRREASD